jgi:hypothetical protein
LLYTERRSAKHNNGLSDLESLMLTALVLVCSLAVTPDLMSCNKDNAVSVTVVQEPTGNPTMCLMHGQAYLAETTMGRNLADDERVKVICAPARTRS